MPDFLSVLLRGVVVACHMDLDVLALNLLHGLLLVGLVLPILVKLREAGPDVVNE